MFENMVDSLKELQRETASFSELTENRKRMDETIENITAPLLIMVMGEFSTGKSSFINALVEKEVAIVGATATTAVITKLCYGLEDRITVFFQDGTQKNYSVEDFEVLTVESEETIELRRNIDFVERALPLEMLKSMTIIDSPGLNSLNQSHEETTRRFMDKSDTVIWLFDAHEPCKPTEFDAMKRLNPRLSPLVLVNKMDSLNEDEGDSPEKILSDIGRKLRNNRLEIQDIIGISAKLAFQGKQSNDEKALSESNIGEFYNRVETVILPHREEYKRNAMFDSLAQVIFEVGTVLADKKNDNDKQKDTDYAAYIEAEETLALATDALENVLEDFLGFFGLSGNTFSDEQVNKMKLNAAERTVFGVLYWLGMVAEKNTETAQKYLEGAAVRNDAVAQRIFAEICERLGQKDKAKYWWDRLGIKKSAVKTKKNTKRKNNFSNAAITSQSSLSTGSYGLDLIRIDNDKSSSEEMPDVAAIAAAISVKVSDDNLSAEEEGKILIDETNSPISALNPLNFVQVQPKSSNVFRIVVIGEFSRGKSTFINALLGKRLLPTGKRPTTVVPTIVKYGDTLEYRVYRKGYTAPLKISQDECFSLQEYPDDEETSDSSFIECAEISCQLPFCKDNVEIVDTSAINAINGGRMEITYGYLNQADAVVMMLSAEQLLPASEAQFIQKYFHGDMCKRLFFVIGFKDRLNDVEDEKEVIDFFTRRLQAILPNFNLQNRIFLVNSLGALYFRMRERGEKLTSRQMSKIPDNFNDTGFPAVEKALLELQSEKAAVTHGSASSTSNLSVEEMLNKGSSYEKEQNYSEAMKWYRKAVDAGNAEAKKKVAELQSKQDPTTQSVTSSTLNLSAREMFNKGLSYEKKENYTGAMKLYHEAADAGDAYAMRKIGELYYLGKGVTQDYAEAMKWYRKAADAGNVVAMSNIGWLYQNGNGVNQDYAEAMTWYRKAADAGNTSARQKFSELQNFINKQQQKLINYRKAADVGDVEAMYNIGCLYENGEGVSQDYVEAIKWFRKAADAGNVQAMYSLGRIYQDSKDSKSAIKWYKKAADAGDATAMYNIGLFYHNGKGITQDYAKAMKWYRRAADAGNTSARQKFSELQNFIYKQQSSAQSVIETTSHLSVEEMYEKGCSCEKQYDYPEAMKWYRKAADTGNVQAMYSLGRIYQDSKDSKSAIKWYKKAADAGDATAMYNIGLLYERGYGVKQDGSKAMKWYNKAVDAGNLSAMHNIGWLYEKGNGVPQDYTEAMKWYRKAVDAGDIEEEECVKRIQRKIEAQEVADNKKKGFCFITTAVCGSFHKPDNCYELTMFRSFRDNWLSLQADGASLINEYYRIAPTIVKNINLRENAKEIYRDIWKQYLRPCLRYIESGDNLRCKELYISMVNSLREKFAPASK